MFGMLDYRAHKLFWLICLPFKVAAWVVSISGLVVIALFVQSRLSTYPFPARLVTAWGLDFAFGLILWIILVALYWVIRGIFYWTVDVVPTRGSTPEEARLVVETGPIYLLNRKLMNDIGNWTDEDSHVLISKSNWRARLMFPAKDRTLYAVERLKSVYLWEGKQPAELSNTVIQAIRESYPGQQAGWLERAITNPIVFQTTVRLGLMWAILALTS